MKIKIVLMLLIVVIIGCNKQSNNVTTSENYNDYSALDTDIIESNIVDSIMSISAINKWREEYYDYQSSEYDY